MSKITIQLCLLILFLTIIHSKTAEEFLSCVKEQIGKEYVKGAEGPDYFDDSGLVYYCFDKQIPRNINEQFKGGSHAYGIPGDLVFFGKKNEDPIHVGICMAEDIMVHAPGQGQNIFYFNYKDSPLYSIKGYRRYFTGESLKSRFYLVDVYFYTTKYSDLKNYNSKDAFNHFYDHGRSEGRSPSLFYDPKFYADNNPDLKNAYGYNWGELFKHFFNHGVDELRNTSPIYYADYYKKKYPDLKNLDGKGLYMHFMDIGIKEGRQASPNFDVASYMAKNPDLVKAYGNDLKRYYYHYLIYGIDEKRSK